jgi:bile acid-coenzyme A ligase
MARLLSYGAALRYHAERDPDRPCVTDDRGTLTRAEFDRRSDAFAHEFLRRGVALGSLVALALPNESDFLAATFGAWKIGAVPQPLPPSIPIGELREIVRVSRPRVVVGMNDFGLQDVECVPPEFELPPPPEAPLPDAVPPYLRAPVSGGSTGKPKVILLSGNRLVDPMVPTMPGMTLDGTHLVPSKLYYGAPFAMTCYGLVAGCHIVLMKRFDPEQTLQLIERHRIDWMFVVPTMMQRIWRLDAARHRYDLGSLREVFHSAAVCPAWLKQCWIDWLGPDKLFEIYGATESRGFTAITGAEWLEHRGSVGKPVPGTEVAVMNESGSPVAPREIGEIYFRSTTVNPSEYIGASKRALPGGWESVGDMGWLDEEGYLYIADRRTDMIVTGGANVYPAEVEAALERHPAVRCAVVIGLPSGDLGNRVHAIVEADAPVGEDELQAHLEQYLTAYKRPRSYEFVASPLRDDNGKVRRQRLRDERIQGFGLTPFEASSGSSP